MNSNMTIRMNRELLAKFRFIAEYNARSANREVELLIRRHVEAFEQEHGAIDLRGTPWQLEPGQ